MDNQQYYGYAPQQGYGQQYGQQYQQQPRQQQRRPSWLCVPVSCREEAVAVQMDYLYSGIIMPDVVHNAVYAKIVDPKTMETRFCDFAAVPPPKMVTADEFVTRDDFRKLCEIVQQMQSGKQAAPAAARTKTDTAGNGTTTTATAAKDTATSDTWTTGTTMIAKGTARTTGGGNRTTSAADTRHADARGTTATTVTTSGSQRS